MKNKIICVCLLLVMCPMLMSLTSQVIEADFSGIEEKESTNQGIVENPYTDSPWSNPFVDVDVTSWYFEAVKYVNSRGWMLGSSEVDFLPNTQAIRGTIVQSLYFFDGRPSDIGTSKFKDVSPAIWCYEPVTWAYNKGIVSGYDDETFGIQDYITREQFATILYRYMDYKGYDKSKSVDLSSYEDKDEISSWALEAISWANAEGLINGRTETSLVPKGTITKAEVAVILMRFNENVVDQYKISANLY